MYIHVHVLHILLLPQEVEVLKVKASRVDKLQAELSTHRQRVEESSKLSARLKVYIVSTCTRTCTS